MKYVPRSLQEQDVKECLSVSIQNEALCISLLDIERYEVEENDVRWILLFKTSHGKTGLIEIQNLINHRLIHGFCGA